MGLREELKIINVSKNNNGETKNEKKYKKSYEEESTEQKGNFSNEEKEKFEEEFKKYLEKKGLAKRSIKEYINYYKYFTRITNKHPKRTFQKDIDNFLEFYNNKVSRAFLKNLFKYLLRGKDYYYLTREEVLRISSIDIPKRTGRQEMIIPRVLSEHEVLLIEKVMSSEREKLMLLLSFYSGLRSQELIGIKKWDVLWEKWWKNPGNTGEILVHGKGSKDGIAFVPSHVMYRLEKYVLDNEGKIGDTKTIFLWTDSTWRKKFKKYSKQALGIDLHPHLLRHSCATALFDAGMDSLEVKELLRHSSVNTTQIYTHMSMENLKSRYKQMWQ